MLKVLYFCLALSFCILQAQSSDYTWENYDGTIPEKAFIASDDPNNPVYVGMAEIGKSNCSGTLLPGANEMMVECNGGMHKVKEGLKILTVNDPKKFKWFPTPRKGRFWEDIKSVGNAVTSGHSVSRQKSATLVGRTITDDDGTLVVGHVNQELFYLIHNNQKRQKSSGYEVLIIVEKPVPPPPQRNDYTWENYGGTIPEKAFSASDNPNNPVYVGLASLFADYCPGTLLPGATEITVECYGEHTTQKDLKILTVNDPTKFKWFPTPRKGRFWEDIKSVGNAVTSGHSVSRQKSATLVGRTITDDDGTLVVGHVNQEIFYLIHNNQKRQKSSGYEVLIIVEKPVPPPPQRNDYTWENYGGTIPEKAFSASDNPNNPVYVGLAPLFADYCPGTLLPGATEITVECYGAYTIKKDLKILTVNDPTKFKWFPTPRKGRFWEDIKSVGNAVTSGHSVSRQKSATLVGRTITDDDGTLVVGHVNQEIFYLIHNNQKRQKSSGYEVLIIVEKPVPPPPQSKDYTWKDYNGTMPEEAFSASGNPNNPVYVGLASLFADYCPGTLLPGATEITVECYGEHTTQKDLKILTVNDPKKFKWVPAPPKGRFWEDIKKMGKPVSSGHSVSRQKSSTLVGRTIVDGNGTLVVGHVNQEAFYFIHKNKGKQISSNYEVLIIVEEPAPAQPQNKEPLASEEPTAAKPSEPTVDTNVDPKVETDAQTASVSALDCTETTVDIKTEADAPAAPKEPPIPKASSVPEEPSTPKAPSTSKEPTPLHPSEPSVDTNVNLQAEAALNSPSAPKESSTPEAPSASKELPTLNPSEPTVNTNVDLKVEADAQAAPKLPFAPKTPSVPKEPSTPKSPSAAALNPSGPTVGTNVDLKVEADAQAAPKSPFAPKTPSVPKEPSTPKSPSAAALNPIEPTVGTNVDLKVEADAQAAPKSSFAPKTPSVPKEPSTPKSPSAAALNPSGPTVGANVDLKVEAAPEASFAPKAQFALKEPTVSKAPFGYKAPAASNPNLPTVDANVDLKAPAAPKAPTTPNSQAAPKADFKVNSFAG